VRIIAGALKGRRLAAPSWPGLRPTSDRLRETLFNVLGARVAGARVVDACAGTGAVGLEALSRGAAHVTFVEPDRRAVALIGRNLAHCGVAEAYTMIPAAVEAVGARLEPRSADLVVMDPPYDAADLASFVGLGARWLAPGGWLVLEHAARRDGPEAAGGLARFRRLGAGDSALSFYAATGGPGAASTSGCPT